MKYKIKYILCSLIISLLLSAHTAYARFILIEEGQVTELNNTSIMINDSQFRISPTVKVITASDEKGNLNDIKTGDYVRISVIKFNKRLLVDSINILDRPARQVLEH